MVADGEAVLMAIDPKGTVWVTLLCETAAGAGDGIRTREYKLGKLEPYHLATPARLGYSSTSCNWLVVYWLHDSSTY